MSLIVRPTGIAQPTVKVGLANLACTMRRAAWLTQRRAALA